MTPRQGHPDYAVDADRGSSSTPAKRARLLDTDAYVERADTRQGLRELDVMTGQMTSLTALEKDRERIFPRDRTAPAGHPRMIRTLPAAGAVRAPLSARQRNARSKNRLATQATMPMAQLRALRGLVTQPELWQGLNDQLSDAVGDVQALPVNDQEHIRRIDRSIQSYERNNDRGHVLYTNVQLPGYINPGNARGFVRNNFKVGERISFDRYSAATHQLHETAAQVPNDLGTVVVFEMQTRRGVYLGRSDKLDNTQHLLPRGLELEVAGVADVSYRAPDGTTGRRLVVQLLDVTAEHREEG